MRLLKSDFCLALFLFLLMLIDGQISFAFSFFLKEGYFISAHLFLAGTLLFSARQKNIVVPFTIILILGMIYDLYYFNHLGIMVVIMPILFLFGKYVSHHFLNSFFASLLIFILVLFLADLCSYLLAFFYGMTDVSLARYITYSFAPSLLLNLLLFVLFYKILKKIFLNNEIVTNA